MRKRFAIIVLLLVLVGFAYGLKTLFEARFEAGDIYPEYSSLRTDPLGSKALYESLGEVIPIERNYKERLNPDLGRASTFFLLGLDPQNLHMSASDMRQLDGLLAKGGRLVIALLPTFDTPRTASKFTKKTGPAPSTQAPEEARAVSAEEKWGFTIAHKGLGGKLNKESSETAFTDSDAPETLPKRISCHTTLFFDKLDSAWQVIYARTNDSAVLITRSFGKGSIVLCADSWLFSNESLLKERHPTLLAWVAGNANRLVFDETHLHVHENSGIVTLGRKYGLESVFLALLLLAALYIWKSSVSFLPPYQSESELEQANVVVGKEASEGFINLLRRNIAPNALLGICLSEWKKSCLKRTQLPRLQAIQEVINRENQAEPRARNPLATYRAISQILSRKSTQLAPSIEPKHQDAIL